MAIAAEKGGRETLATTFILDGDVHLNEPPAELAEYAEPPWDIGLREIAKIGGGYLSLPGMSPKADFRVPWPGGQNRSQVVTNAADMRRELDDLHVDVAVLFPDNLLTLPMVRDPRFALALAKAYNAWMCERWLSAEPSLRGALVACPAAARGERRRHPPPRRATPACAVSTCLPAGSGRFTAISSTSPSGGPRLRPGFRSRSIRSRRFSRPSRSSSTASRPHSRSTRSRTRSR